jgi:hypothetical protein
MKKCYKCHIEKELSEFYFKKTENRYDGMCKYCHRLHRKQHYKENRQYYLDKKKRNADKYFEQNKKLVLNTLKPGCVDCGETNILCLQFDHLGDKKGDISTMIKTYKPETVKKEIEKCEVVCANCHAKRTVLRSGDSWKLKHLQSHSITDNTSDYESDNESSNLSETT